MPWFEIQKGLGVRGCRKTPRVYETGVRDGGKSSNVRNEVRLNISSWHQPAMHRRKGHRPQWL